MFAQLRRIVPCLASLTLGLLSVACSEPDVIGPQSFAASISRPAASLQATARTNAKSVVKSGSDPRVTTEGLTFLLTLGMSGPTELARQQAMNTPHPDR